MNPCYQRPGDCPAVLLFRLTRRSGRFVAAGAFTTLYHEEKAT